jgi:hypothetical protein
MASPVKNTGVLWLWFVVFCGVNLAAPGPVRAVTLRGLGSVDASALPEGQGMRFECDSPEHAKWLIHKLARDMALSATVPSRWPGPGQNAFVQDLLEGLGVPPDVPANTQAVWRDRYVANNGTEEYLVLWNPSDTDAQHFTTDWHTSFPATQVFDPKTGQAVAAQIEGTSIRLSQSLEPLETRILAVQSQRAPADTVAHWWTKTAEWWKASRPGHTVSYPELPVFYAAFPPGAGKVVDTAAATPEALAALSSAPGSAEGWDNTLCFIAPWYDGIAVKDGQSVLYRSSVETPASWQPGDRYILRLKRYPRGGFNGVVYLNGK